MNKVYKKIFIYRPGEDKVTFLKRLPYGVAADQWASDEAFYDVYKRADHKREIVVGESIFNNYYQLSPAAYGTYIKENASSMKFINMGKMRCSLVRYIEEHHLSWEDFDDD